MKHSLKNNILFSFLVVAILGWIGCEKKPPKDDEEVKTINNDLRLYIANEGNYGSGNSSLSLYYLNSEKVFNNVFEKNNNEALGDVLNDIALVNNNLWLVVNNSNKIEIIDTFNHKKIHSINISQPRNITILDATRVLITSMYFNKLYVVNTNNYQIEKTIIFPYPNVENLVVHQQFAYVCNWDTACNKIYKVNIETLNIEDSLSIPYKAPQSICIDKENHLWVLSGNIYSNVTSRLTVLDLNGSIIKQFQFPNNADLIKLKTNASKDVIYFLGVDYQNNGNNPYNGVFKLPIQATEIPSKAFIMATTLQYFWDYSINPTNNDIFISDPKGFIQKGDVLIYNDAGNYKSQFETSIGTGKLFFMP